MATLHIALEGYFRALVAGPAVAHQSACYMRGPKLLKCLNITLGTEIRHALP